MHNKKYTNFYFFGKLLSEQQQIVDGRIKDLEDSIQLQVRNLQGQLTERKKTSGKSLAPVAKGPDMTEVGIEFFDGKF